MPLITDRNVRSLTWSSPSNVPEDRRGSSPRSGRCQRIQVGRLKNGPRQSECPGSILTDVIKCDPSTQFRSTKASGHRREMKGFWKPEIAPASLRVNGQVTCERKSVSLNGLKYILNVRAIQKCSPSDPCHPSSFSWVHQ